MSGVSRWYWTAILLTAVGLVIGMVGEAAAQDAASRELGRLEVRFQAGQLTPQLGNDYHNLAMRLRNRREHVRAERPARRALAVWENVHGRASGAVANACNTLAAILDQLRKDEEAEQYARRAVAIWEKQHGLESGQAANALNTLVGIMRTRGRWVDAEQPARRVVRIWTKTNGARSDAVANSSNTLADVLLRLGKYVEAERLARDALQIWQKLHGPDSEAADNARNTLAGALDGLGRKDEARREQLRVLESWSRRYGPRSGAVGLAANNLAWKQLGAGHVDDAEKLFGRTLDIWSEVDTRPWKPSTGIPLSGLSRTALLKRDWSSAYVRIKLAVRIAIERTRTAPTQTAGILASQAPSEISQSGGNLQLLIKAAHQIASVEPFRQASLSSESYEYAQWRLEARAADALAAMASRAGVGSALASLLRQRQDLATRWQVIDRRLEAERNKAAAQRDKKAEQVLLNETGSIEARIGELDRRLSNDFVSYAAIARAAPLTLKETQLLLNPDEMLVLPLPTGIEPPIPEETFLWIVTKNDVRWVRSDLGTDALKREIAVLRCGLEPTLMDPYYFPTISDSDNASVRAQKTAVRERMKFCFDNLPEPQEQDVGGHMVRLAPFDLERAHRLYLALFGEVEDLIKGKDLLIVPSGPLTQLPFQLLVTRPPEPGLSGLDAMRKAAWLIRDHTITVLPAVSSLKALREHAKASKADRAYIGFGNPLLDGSGEEDRNAALAARQLATCEEAQALEVARLDSTLLSPRPLAQSGGMTNVAEIRRQAPLPSTAAQVCNVARHHNAVADVHLGARATESVIKAMGPALSRYRILHFATHGTLAGELKGTSEPGLILTPPKTATEADDGYLSASEVASLKLDADWVVLSACNTAAGGSESAEALSGLARAFFYAGTRSLLVSHWAVYDQSTAQLIENAVGSTTAQGRAKALQSAMLGMIDNGPRLWSHPTYWAPFILVGEGAPAK